RGGVRFRSGKALVPFRITGNIEWGVPVDDSCGCHGLTCWVWPESLWAPISFTRTALAEAERAGKGERYASLDWHDWWCSEDAPAYQFIGQDNIYFYGIAQTALWAALGCNMQQSTLVANYHVLYMGKKASSSSKTPPPPASELLEHYDTEQLRAHFLSLGLSEKPVSFSPKAYDLRETGKNPDGTALLARDDKRVIDPVLKEGTLLTGVFNRLARSCFYGVAEREGDESLVRTGCIPAGSASAEAADAIEQAVLGFEDAMHRFEFHRALGVCDAFLRAANKRWSDASKAAKAAGAEDPARGDDLMKQALVDAFAELRVATVLMHGVVPRGCELICEYFDIAPEAFFSWDHVLETTDEFVRALGEEPGSHRVKVLPPRFDFFAY
ncbi:class I tRNA ligase family protein, partial [uncultured Enorma sp.]|uniref:class I tRNA ligase family protein n=1 Tax=uncultured Enorma sp. TaxID=1714346 RepID=UPI0025CD036E